jgi:hypothetical protein
VTLLFINIIFIHPQRTASNALEKGFVDPCTGMVTPAFGNYKKNLYTKICTIVTVCKIKSSSSSSSTASHHAEGLVGPNLRYKKTVTGFRYPRACRFRKYQFENRSWEFPLPTFFKT